MILPQAFWDAFESGKYPQTFCDTIFYLIEDFAKHLEGLGYTFSIYREEYAINFFAIQGAFHISIFSTRESHPLLGIINYQLGRKKQEMCYYEKRMTENPDALSLLRKISIQLTSKGLEIDERSIKGGSLPFQRPIKTMICSVKWRELIETEPEFTPKERAEQIAVDVELDPITVAGYASSSTDPVVKSEAIQVMKLLGEAKRDITRKWRKLKDTAPNLSPLERVEQIATGEKLDPMTIAWYGSVSIDPEIRSEAYLLYKQLGEAKRDITGKWQELMENDPHLTPQDRAERIATHEGVDIMTVASYGRFSVDPAVKSEAIHLFKRLGAAKHDITMKWRKLKDNTPSLSPRERAEKIAADIELDPLTVAGHGRASLDLEIRSEAHKAYKQLFESKLGITERWRELKAKKPHLVPEEIAQQIAIDLKVDSITIGGYGRASPDPEVKSEAHIADYRLRKLGQVNVANETSD